MRILKSIAFPYSDSDTNRRGGVSERERSGLSLSLGERELEYLKNTLSTELDQLLYETTLSHKYAFFKSQCCSHDMAKYMNSNGDTTSDQN